MDRKTGWMSRKRRSPARKPVSSNPLPNVDEWQPRTDVSESLAQSFRRRCLYADKRLRLRVAEEKAANLNNFDSGIGVEEIFRDELQELLPRRYKAMTGVLTDRHGYTAGHCDTIIFNDTWFPAIKAAAIEGSRRPHLPIEGAYAVIEVKQSLSEKALDEAMEKLVTCNRLHRPLTPRDRITENRETGSCTHFISNPLYSAIFAVDVAPRNNFQQLIARFFQINQLLKRREMVNAIISLNHGCVVWGYLDGMEMRPALFSGEDLASPIRPGFFPFSPGESPLYPFIQNLSSHLYHSVLGAEDIVTAYGDRIIGATPIRGPQETERWQILPDPELEAFFRRPCEHDAEGCSHPYVKH
jgi:hypothetical protein